MDWVTLVGIVGGSGGLVSVWLSYRSTSRNQASSDFMRGVEEYKQLHEALHARTQAQIEDLRAENASSEARAATLMLELSRARRELVELEAELASARLEIAKLRGRVAELERGSRG